MMKNYILILSLSLALTYSCAKDDDTATKPPEIEKPGEPVEPPVTPEPEPEAKETFAQGNLIVDQAGLLAIGKPSDVGLMFKFGSVVGASGSDVDDNTTFEATDILYNPSKVVVTNEWKSVPYEKGYYGMNGVSHTHSKVIDKGIGDPCRLVGLSKEQIQAGTIDNQIWRLPTRAEMDALIANRLKRDETDRPVWIEIDGIYGMRTKENDYIFFPSGGTRSEVIHTLSNGFAWTSTTLDNSQKGYFMHFNAGSAKTLSWDNDAGYAARCVRQ